MPNLVEKMAIHHFLAARFSREFVKLPFWRSDMFKGYILFKHLPICSQLSFESAAIIGEYFSSKKETFVDLLGGRGERREILDILKKLWDKKLREFGRSPKDFSDLLMESERTRILTGFRNSMTSTEKKHSVWDAYLAEGDTKIPVMSFLPYLSDFVLLEGLAGGLHYPEVVRRLWHKSYEIVPDEATVNEFAKNGLFSPMEKQTVMEPKPLKERQVILLAIVRDYVSKHFPDSLELFS
jgi:hypothetical protein